ncbi:uncharacterized protein LOC112455054 [Temnothorax curvispinosus]|uniref:Uncharacterized protein LOC112455054 n=1 Tax=Temnothorax curvispinosus TaxID=300111 RepID=A0A6J1PTC5_9HYME|nr:uncharacterized protein LOC112455054 [Temnothorax curvispinosus]
MPTLRAKIWEHFKKLKKLEDSTFEINSRYCDNVSVKAASRTSLMTHMRIHMQSCHQNRADELRDEQDDRKLPRDLASQFMLHNYYGKCTNCGTGRINCIRSFNKLYQHRCPNRLFVHSITVHNGKQQWRH